LPISLPPRDTNGLAMLHDHAEILDTHRVIRGVSDEFVVNDDNGQPQRLSSALLDPSAIDVDPYCGLSVDLEHLMTEDGVDPVQYVKERKFLGAIVFGVRSFRSRNFFVGYDPRKGNPYHGGVWQDGARGSKLTRGVRMALLREAAWLVQIDDVPVVAA
jgi:hypothetical protein